jgi:glucose-1-phosphate thymidylyltransferase
MKNELQGVILAGGKGIRLKPLTNKTNKHLLPVGNKPLILHVIKQLTNANITDIVLMVDDIHKSKFVTLLKDGKKFGLSNLIYGLQPSGGRGLPTAIGYAEPFINGDKFVVACGDVLTEMDIENAIRDFQKQGTGARILGATIEDTAGFSKLSIKGEKIEAILPKDKKTHNTGRVDLGIYMYHKDVFDNIKKLIPSNRGETEIRDLNQFYIDAGELFVSKVDGWWSDVGSSLSVYEEVNKRYGEK